ncbi:MAG: DMT family transporter [Pleurocapsa sp.]
MNNNHLSSEAIKPNHQTFIVNNLQSYLNLETKAIAFIILFIALIALSCSPIFTKLSEVEISPNATIFNRLWIATAILSFYPNFDNSPTFKNTTQNIVKSPHNYRQAGLLILASLAATASALFWAWSFTQTSVASSTVLRSLTPLFISIMAWCFLKQRCDRQFFWGMLLAIVGGMTIGWDDLQLGTEYLIGDGIALASAALHGINLLVAGHLRDQVNTTTILRWRCGLGALIILPFLCLTEEHFFPYSLSGWLVIISLAIVCQLLGQGLLVYSLKEFSSSFVAVFMLLKPVVTALLAWMIFAENLSLFNVIALVLVLLGIYLAKSSGSASNS